ncbi:hypothetical protein ACPOL_5996 [Acidisarcina polymorpha]|uniref:Condensation domain-containing protein n=1 Tax=Acidisarcina polymorpha TaxID=2211140 RepID=A0A2Z5G8C8_9BACT|nr:condensation domain-containing protein [Acidisarcina polymorpha]AXC15240.1 hypothetical protein ACPOL_5996 [Acidisarcina polymorpha]
MQSTLSESKKELLQKLMRGGTKNASKKSGIIPRAPGSDIPMAYAQQQIWLHSQFSPRPIYNESVTIHRRGALDRDALERAFTEIVRRHEAWRTTFGWKGSELVQFVQPPPTHIEIPYLDVSTVAVGSREAAALKIAHADTLTPFDLAIGPMYRPRLIRFSEEEHRLYLTLHHIIFDGVSLYQAFLPELQELYEAFSRGRPSPLKDLPLQYGDYAIWQRGWVDEISQQQLGYWRDKLKGIAWRDLIKTDSPRDAMQGYRGDMIRVALDSSTSDALKKVSQEMNATLFMTLLATFYLLVWAYSGEEDLVIGVSSASRNRSELDGMLGCFLNTVLVRTDLSGGPTFPEFVHRCKDELFGALANDGLPFSLLVKELSAGRDSNKHSLFQVLFSFEPPLASLMPGWKFTRMDVNTGSAKFDLHLELDEFPEGIEGRLIYNADLFERETVQRMMATWRGIVDRVVADVSQPIYEVIPPMAAKSEAAPTRDDMNASSSPDSGGWRQSIRRLFGKQKTSNLAKQLK